MTENDATTDSRAPDSKTPREGVEANGKRTFVLSVVALVVGVIALGLASIPALALGRPLPNPFAEPEKEQPAIERPPEREGGLTLKYKNFSVNFGGKTPVKEPAPKSEPKPEITKAPIRWFTISAIACSLTGLVIASIAQLRERHTVLTMGSMGCCAAAITWQYIAIGIAVGVAAAVFLIVLGMIGSAVGS